MSVRSLWNWEKAARGDPVPLGRPPHASGEAQAALQAVCVEWERQGRPGWRPVARGLPGVPVRLVQRSVAELKRRTRKADQERREAHQVRVEVLARDAVWARDGLFCGRRRRSPVEGEVMRDRGSMRMVMCEVQEGALAGELAVERWERVRRERGLPLVVQLDNGSANRSEAVREYLARHQVIVLWNLPRTPEHNGAAEKAVGEVKRVAGLGRGTCLSGVREAQERLDAAVEALDRHRRRASKGWRTAMELDGVLPSVHTAGRARFYEVCKRRMEEAVLDAKTWRKARLAEREAVWSALEEFGLVRRTRGGAPYRPAGLAKAERIS